MQMKVIFDEAADEQILILDSSQVDSFHWAEGAVVSIYSEAAMMTTT